MSEETLFDQAARLPVAERAEFLERECVGQPELRARVAALLAADEASRVPLDRPLGLADPTGDYAPSSGASAVVGSSGAAQPRSEHQAGTVIGGKYTLVEAIGDGGMGSVWRAKQSEPVKRFVAVKLIKAGMDSRQVLARFEAERQALALMDHPNIAKVLDGGLHEQRPYFVMELVKGAPITEFCDQLRLSLPQRLELFVQACQAIQHAHQKGIIHRDIKPSNVLVALYDDRPVVKVIDFGVAKATGGALTEATIDTGFGGVVGTPQYMSPEQATFNNLDIDTRSDVYALGVLLYELLVGSPPFSGNELKKKGLLEMLRVVREDEPPRPSTRLSTADALPSLSANRGTEPKQLTGLLRNELDWVVMKALEKDRSRRYETANGFAADILRFLAGEAVLAHPPSAAYRLKKFARRHRAQVIAAGLLFCALAAGVVGTTWGLVQAKRQERAALAAADREREAREREAARAEGERLAKEQTQKRLTQIEKGVSLFAQLLQGIDPRVETQGGEPLYAQLRRRAEKAADDLDAEAVGDSLVVARLQTILAETLRELGNPAKAIELGQKALAIRERELGPLHIDTCDTLTTLAGAYMNRGRASEAVTLMERVRDVYVEQRGADDPVTLQRLADLALAYQGCGRTSDAIALLERVHDTRAKQLGPDHPALHMLLNNLAIMYQSAGNPPQAFATLKRVLDLALKAHGPEHPFTLSAQQNLATAYFDAKQYGKTIELLEPIRHRFSQKLGADHPSTLGALHNLAVAYRVTGRESEAMALWEQIYDVQSKTLGPDHPLSIASVVELANSYQKVGKIEEAIPLLVRARDAKLRTLGVDHPNSFNTLMNLANAYRATGRLNESIAQFEIILESQRSKFGKEDLRTIETIEEIAECRWLLGLLDVSIATFEEVLAQKEKQLGRDDKKTLITIANLGVNYKDAGRLVDAIPLLEETARKVSEYPILRFAVPQLLEAYSIAGNQAAASKLIEEMLAEARAEFPNGGLGLVPRLIPIGQSLIKLRRFAEAEPLLRECLGICDANRFSKWNLHLVQSDLGAALLGQEKYADAEPLLLRGYTGLKAREDAIPPISRGCFAEALDRLIALYAATERPDEAARYRELRGKLSPPRDAAATREASK